MRIAIACASFKVMGGRERDCLAIATGLAALGHEVTLVTSDPPPRPPTGIAVQRIGAHGLSNHGRAWSFSRSFAAWRDRHHVDASLGFDRMRDLDFFYCADQPRRRHRGLRRFLPRDIVYRQLEEAVFGPQSRTRIFFLSEAQIGNYRAVHALADDRFELLPLTLKRHHVRPARFYASRQRIRAGLDIHPEAPLLINIAAYGHQKGVDRALEALAAIPEAHFLSVGMTDPAQFKAQAKRLGLSRRAHFLSHSDDIAGLVGAADLMVHPARAETTGNVIVESLLYGVPVVCTALCGYSVHVARSGGGIVLPDPFRQEALEAALARAVQPAALERLRDAARQASVALAAAPGMDAVVEQIAAAMQSQLRSGA